MIRCRQAQVILRRSMATRAFAFETGNGEQYVAREANQHYQQQRPGFKGVTFAQQGKLPSLPVPALGETLQRYLQSVEPLCGSQEELARQRELCAEFEAGAGQELHARLEAFARDKRNWMSEFWDNQSYLEYNDPIVPYVSYFYGHRPLAGPQRVLEQDHLVKATALVSAVVKFIEVLKDEALPAEQVRGAPFCMNSFNLMFNTSRLPGKGRDSNVFYSLYENDFITVAYRGQFYKVVTHEGGRPLGPGAIWQQLYDVVNKAAVGKGAGDHAGVGLLTTLPRDEWYVAHRHLEVNAVSRASLETIHRSSFLLALDTDQHPISLEDKAHNNWHGDGVNRFNDKALQFFVCGNGVSGFLAEHSKMDGTPTLFLNQYVMSELSRLDAADFINQIKTTAPGSNYQPKHLPFVVTPALQEMIRDAEGQFRDVIGEHDLRVWNYVKYGKKAIKAFGFSPDAYIQQIIQLAIYKYVGRQLPTYEAGSTRKFFKGRTEAGRGVSPASAKFVKTWQSPEASPSEKIAALRESAKNHSSLLKMAADGQGVDRHFFGMKNMLRDGEEHPALFRDPLFQHSCTWYVSTSQLSSEYFEGYGWSQVNENGFGLAYMINNDWLHINIVTKPKKSGYSVHELHYYLTEAANEMYELLSNETKVSSKL
ncbi:AAR124Cp [Eremothecium gossypii ATCC 10895]|uniref:Carnitine O-acetyltransferase, mitochondrial n=1 Tax=Eremothecium gossypii (strain ATCC 10895 / CBS 109.51 / FGSC 9923 / NRRL Y-1056) TaxID=284811 RepID=Q75EF7_EREGS|nr:AAR124Cp [Eremothecium gossypii ATCC 10895]AAS50490.1 AAR124Cp [Eremothecium gossypii ATCC 10895]AEY94777.1 FAAR124Cp [Eremothecium gossypii FDAG1]